MRKCQKLLMTFCLLLMAFYLSLGTFSAEDDKTINKDLILVEVRVNGFKKDNTEILVVNEQVFVPIKQLAQNVDMNVSFDRSTKQITFPEAIKSQEVLINPTDKSIKVGDNLLDITANQVYWVKQSVYLIDEALISKELAEQLLNLKINYNEDTLTLEISAPRLLKTNTQKEKKSYNQSQEDDPPDLVRPNKKKFNFQSISPIYTTQANLTERTSQNNSETELGFGNFLGLNVVADAYDGTYLAGPGFFFTDQEVGFAGMRQSWFREYNDNLGVILGDSNTQLSRLNSGGQVFGIRAGTPKSIGISQDTVVSLQGTCGEDSEILLIINDQQIARQICTKGSYQIRYVPRLIDVNNEFKIIQRNTDGTDLILREERFNYFGDLLPKKNKAWQAFVGTPTLELFSSRSSIGLGKDSAGAKVDPFPRKVTGLAQYKYGVSDRLTLETALSGDHLIRDPNEPSTRFLPTFNNQGSLQGQTLSFGLYSRPKDRFGLRLGGALSNSSDQTEAQLSRTGIGRALSLDYDWRFKTFSSIGNFYYFSPEFYNTGSSSNNRAGGNISITGVYKKNFFRINTSTILTNLDKKSRNGLNQRSNISFNHSYRPNNKTQIQNNIVYRKNENDAVSSDIASYRFFVRRDLSKRVSVTASTIATNRRQFQPTEQRDFLGQATLGGILFLDRRKRNQLSQSFTLDTDNRLFSFTQFRWRYKNWIFQPSLSFQTNPQQSRNFRFANGIFWQGTNSSRFGIEYALSSSQSTGSIFDPFGGIIIGSKNKSVTHSVAINVQTVLGFVDNKPRILTSTQTGYIKAKVFFDKNSNSQYEPGEVLIREAKIKLNGRVITANPKGELVAVDIGRGNHKVALDPRSIPITLSPEVDFINVRVEPGLTTEVFFPLKNQSGSIEGRVTIKSNEGQIRPAGNIVITASDLTGKEITYTYTDSNGYYILSDLQTGDYIIQISQGDISSRKLVLEKDSYQINLPVKFDEFVEIKGINFNAIQTIFGIN